MTETEWAAFHRAREIARKVAAAKLDYDRTCPLAWSARLADWLRRTFGKRGNR